MATVSTTFTFSSTDITSDTLSFTVSETLALTGSGGIERLNLSSATNSGSAYMIHSSESFSGSGVSHLYIKNITGSGYSSSANVDPTSSLVHIYMSGSGPAANGQWSTLQGAHSGLPSVAILPIGQFAYLPINNDASYYAYAAMETDGTSGTIAASTIVEFGVFN
jgi:hypothetical protein|tara:strand:+ start:854 stop:1348 length:495 start_codon:yes stop_codon:yes gene_type:complete